MSINLHLLRIFFNVAQERSFSKAAERLYISQPAVSKAVRELEEQLGLPLVERGILGPRSSRGVSLTDSGSALYGHAYAIFELEKAAIDDIQARLSQKSGRLVIGASTTVVGYWLPSYLAMLQKASPNLDLCVISGNTKSMCQALLDYDVDMAVVEGVVEDERLSATRWQEEELEIVTHPSLIDALDLYVNHGIGAAPTWILREEGSGTRAVAMEMLYSLGIKTANTIEIGSNEGIARAVAAGMGATILPSQVVRELVLVGDVVIYSVSRINVLKRVLYVVHVRKRPMTALAGLFMELLMAPL